MLGAPCKILPDAWSWKGETLESSQADNAIKFTLSQQSNAWRFGVDVHYHLGINDCEQQPQLCRYLRSTRYVRAVSHFYTWWPMMTCSSVKQYSLKRFRHSLVFFPPNKASDHTSLEIDSSQLVTVLLRSLPRCRTCVRSTACILRFTDRQGQSCR